MQDIPRGVLSERIQDALSGRVVTTAVFLTFRFEPDFFEQQILPAVLDVALSHVAALRLVQLEEALRDNIDNIAVYYDRRGLIAGEQSAKLDIRRIPISYGTGYFHPKNLFLLTEAAEADESGSRSRGLIVVATSANLTRAGWWENVEVCHIEKMEEGSACGFRNDLLGLIQRVKTASQAAQSHDALDSVAQFVRGLKQREYSKAKNVLYPRFYNGRQPVPDFLDEAAGPRLSGLCLEIISPYFDKLEPGPLRELIDVFKPSEVRVFLPREDEGSAKCSQSLYDAVRALPFTKWGALPSDLLRNGKNENTKPRLVHAKVYRFFNPHRRYEALFVGSANLTAAAHGRGGNFESGFLVETEPDKVPDWWLRIESTAPPLCVDPQEEDLPIAVTHLSIRYNWENDTAYEFWDAAEASGPLSVAAQGVPLFVTGSVPSRQWRRLPSKAAEALKRILQSTSFVTVAEADALGATILVQEDGMAHKPSILFSLTVADILRYWSLFTAEQRAVFLDTHASEIRDAAAELGIDPRPKPGAENSIFATFAGVYHAFGALEQHVLHALDEGRDKEAEYRMLGKKYDSLRSLLDRLLSERSTGDPVTLYVTVLTAKQLVRSIDSKYPAFRERYKIPFKELDARISEAGKVRDHFTFGTPDERKLFLEWFEKWFLAQAQPTQS